MALFSHTDVPAVSPAEAFAMLEEGALLIDIREMDEWTAGHAPSASHVPMGSLGAAASDMSKTTPMVFICRSGRRSHQAVAALIEAGYHVFNLEGGMQAWQQAGCVVVRNDGSTGMVI